MGTAGLLSLFLLACGVGCLGVRSVPLMLHAPLMAAMSAIGAVIIIGAIVANAEASGAVARYLGLAAVALAAAGLFGGFALAGRMMGLHRRKDRE